MLDDPRVDSLVFSGPPLPYPKTDRQSEFVALANTLARVAAANADRHDRENSFPFDTLETLREAGYFALVVPEVYGGRGASPIETMLAQGQLARGDGSVALGTTMHHLSIVNIASSAHWPEHLKSLVLRDVVENGALINGVASEPEMGSPSRGGMYATRAERVDGGWRINGRKTWSTLSPALTYALAQVSVEGGDGSTKRGLFLVPMNTPGIHIEETWDSLAMRSTGSHDVVFEDVLVPEGYRIHNAKDPSAPEVTAWNLLGSSVYLGIATAARDFAVHYCQNRKPTAMSGAPVSELQTVQHRIANIEMLLLQAQSVLYGTAELLEQCPEQQAELAWRVAAAKYITTNNAITITDLALRVVGATGLLKRHPLERYFRDVRAGLGNPPMDDVALTIIGKAALAK
ncbi:acyl-CoA dehydrogenase family protein [soil metagenome]